MSEKENEEWIEKTVICPDCVRGRTVHWKENKSGKHPWRYHLPCTTCKGHYESVISQPKYCQIDDCDGLVEHKCTGYLCMGDGWVCAAHWLEEDIGFSQTGFACITCWHEVGSGGH